MGNADLDLDQETSDHLCKRTSESHKRCMKLPSSSKMIKVHITILGPQIWVVNLGDDFLKGILVSFDSFSLGQVSLLFAAFWRGFLRGSFRVLLGCRFWFLWDVI